MKRAKNRWMWIGCLALALGACERAPVSPLPGERGIVPADGGASIDATAAPIDASAAPIDASAAPIDAGQIVELPDAAVALDAGELSDGGECTAATEPCSDLPCCPGTFCSVELLTYAEGHCYLPLDNGAHCQMDRHCKSGHCVDFVCAD